MALQVALLAGIHILIGFVWLTAYAPLVSRLQAALERATGVVLIALGLSVAVEHR